MKTLFHFAAWVVLSAATMGLAKDLWGIPAAATFRNAAATALALLAGLMLAKAIKP